MQSSPGTLHEWNLLRLQIKAFFMTTTNFNSKFYNMHGNIFKIINNMYLIRSFLKKRCLLNMKLFGIYNLTEKCLETY